MYKTTVCREWNNTWQLLKVLLRLTHDVNASFINISNDTERRVGHSAIAELLVLEGGIARLRRQTIWATDMNFDSVRQ